MNSVQRPALSGVLLAAAGTNAFSYSGVLIVSKYGAK
jgi:hypothetical protein